MLIADYSLGDALLTVLEIFLLFAWFWILITVIGDLFRDHQISGWGKAGWVLLLTLLWAALHDRPVSWACQPAHWKTTRLQPPRWPSPDASQSRA